MSEQLKPAAKRVVNEHIAAVEAGLPGLLDSYHLYGSISLGAYQDGRSDLDFFAILNRQACQSDIEALTEIHAALHNQFRKPILDGFYIPKDELKIAVELKQDASALRFNDGKFQGTVAVSIDSIDIYQLITYGVTIKGATVDALNLSVNWDILLERVKDNLNTYWQSWNNKCKRSLSLQALGLLTSLDMVEWGVLGVSRLFYTLNEKGIVSKEQAGEYALQTVPKNWHKIINEALRLRKGIPTSYYKSVFERRKDAVAYIDFIIDKCNTEAVVSL